MMMVWSLCPSFCSGLMMVGKMVVAGSVWLSGPSVSVPVSGPVSGLSVTELVVTVTDWDQSED